MLGVIPISVLLYVLVPVESVFYLEIPQPTVEAIELIEITSGKEVQDKKGQEGRRFVVKLYECETSNKPIETQVKCRPILKSVEREKIYADVNFNAIANFVLPPKHAFKIDSAYYTDQILPQILAIGTTPEQDTYLSNKIQPLANTDLLQSKLYPFVGRLVHPEDESGLKALLKYVTINHVGYFYGRDTATARQIFARFVTALQKLVNATGYKKGTSEPWLPDRFDVAPKIRIKPQPQPKPKPQFQPEPQPKSRSQSPCPGGLCSRIKSRSSSGRFSNPLRSLSNKVRRSLSRSKSRSNSFSQSQFPVAQSPSRSPPRRSSSKSNLSDREILEVAGVLALKMFDPCTIYEPIIMTRNDADHACEIYCQFMGATAQVYRQSFAKKCEQLQFGVCLNKKCMCGPSENIQTLYVKMSYCNNALRLHIYEQAAGNLSFEG